MFERLGVTRPLLWLIADIVLTELALYLASVLRPLLPFGRFVPVETARLNPLIYLFVAVIWVVAFMLLSVYVPRTQRFVDEAQALFVAVTLTTMVLAGILYFSFRGVSRLQILLFYALTLVFLTNARLIGRLLSRLKGQPDYARRRVLILGAGETGRELVPMLERHQWAGLELVGFLDDGVPAGTELSGHPVLGKIEDLVCYVESERVEEVVVALPPQGYDQLFELIAHLQKLPTRVRLIPDHIKTALFRTRVEEFAGVPMITLQQPCLTPFERQIKRAFDLIVGTVFFVLALPLMGLIAIAIRLDSPGRAIYKQERVGENGKIFWMYKFRSMVRDADEQLEELFRRNEDGELVFKFPDDPRVTRVGRFLRRTSLDELPQMINVLKGEMSLVGPRPELPWLVEKYEPWQWQRFSVPQGITGWWQINGRSDKPQHLYTEEDLFYIQNYSLLLDIQILWSTLGAVFRGGGAF
jgi:exopolysaccharide biosynthesis polyprenyl glycosylphosphotransferase